jgi:hypothetical protein
MRVENESEDGERLRLESVVSYNFPPNAEGNFAYGKRISC